MNHIFDRCDPSLQCVSSHDLCIPCPSSWGSFFHSAHTGTPCPSPRHEQHFCACSGPCRCRSCFHIDHTGTVSHQYELPCGNSGHYCKRTWQDRACRQIFYDQGHGFFCERINLRYWRSSCHTGHNNAPLVHYALSSYDDADSVFSQCYMDIIHIGRGLLLACVLAARGFSKYPLSC